MEPLKIVLGLGNPGAAYRSTRHNVGFHVLDRLAERAGVRFRDAGAEAIRADVAELGGGSLRVVLAKPRTWMNRSGRAAGALCRAYEATPQQLLVVHDDADLELGRLRIRRSGSAGGHNGIRSLIDTLQTDGFARLKLGVRGAGRGERELADYVLEPFSPEELPVVEALVDLAVEAAEQALAAGLETAMNEFSGRSALAGADPAPDARS